MPWLGSLIAGALLSIAESMVRRVIMALGIGVVSFTGFTATIGWAKSNFLDRVFQLPPVVVQVMALLGVGNIVSMFFSALLIRLTLNGMQSDTVKSWVKR